MDQHPGPYDLEKGLKVVQDGDLPQNPIGKHKESGIDNGIGAQQQDLAPKPSLTGLQNVVQTKPVFQGKDPQGKGQSENEGFEFDNSPCSLFSGEFMNRFL